MEPLPYTWEQLMIHREMAQEVLDRFAPGKRLQEPLAMHGPNRLIHTIDRQIYRVVFIPGGNGIQGLEHLGPEPHP